MDSDKNMENSRQVPYYPRTDPDLAIEGSRFTLPSFQPPRTDPDLSIGMPRFTLPSIQPPLEEVMTIQMPALKQGVEYDLAIFETSPISMIVEEQTLDSRGLEQIVTLRVPKVSASSNAEDDEAFVLQTVSIRTVNKKRARNRARTVLMNGVALLLSILFLSVLAAIIIVIPGIIYKLQLLLVLLIAFSYVTSLYLKRIRKARQQKYLTVTQFLQAVKKMRSSSEDDDMKHFKLVKEDTITYLRALTTKELKKDS